MLAAVLAAIPFLSGVTAVEHLTLPSGPAPLVSVVTTAGSIRVESGGAGVEVVATKKASTATALAALKVVVVRGAGRIAIRASYANGCAGHCDGGISFDVRVPAGASLDLATQTGNIAATGLSGDARLSTTVGTLDARYSSVTGVRRIEMREEIGRVTLALPSSAQLGRVRASTMVGRVNSDWPLEPANALVVGSTADRAFTPGGVDVRLQSTVGAVYLLKRP